MEGTAMLGTRDVIRTQLLNGPARSRSCEGDGISTPLISLSYGSLVGYCRTRRVDLTSPRLAFPFAELMAIKL
jgi:hypothetical protein